VAFRAASHEHSIAKEVIALPTSGRGGFSIQLFLYSGAKGRV
jgi:hypothetical protein